jgi:hypothetical protein
VDVTGFTYDFLFCAATVMLLGGVDRKTHLVVQDHMLARTSLQNSLLMDQMRNIVVESGTPSLLSVIFREAVEGHLAVAHRGRHKATDLGVDRLLATLRQASAPGGCEAQKALTLGIPGLIMTCLSR